MPRRREPVTRRAYSSPVAAVPRPPAQTGWPVSARRGQGIARSSLGHVAQQAGDGSRETDCEMGNGADPGSK